MADSLRPGGLLAIDLCDLSYGEARGDAPAAKGWVTDDWALVTEFDRPSPDRFVRQMAIFTRTDEGSWRRDDERHDNVLIDVAAVPDLFASHGVEVALASRFGSYQLPDGLFAITGRKRA